MINIFKKVWFFGRTRQKYFVSALIADIVKSFVGITQLYAVMIAIDTVFGNGQKAVPKLVILTVVCIAGCFATSYIEQISAMKAGFLMTADKRISLGEMLRKVPLGVLSDMFFAGNKGNKGIQF